MAKRGKRLDKGLGGFVLMVGIFLVLLAYNASSSWECTALLAIGGILGGCGMILVTE